MHMSFSSASSRSIPQVSNLSSSSRAGSDPTSQQPSFIEFYDVSGSPAVRHPKSRNMFYTESYQGIILVHDICNKRSYDNLWKWIRDYLDVAKSASGSYQGSGGAGIAVLVVGNKKDLSIGGYDQHQTRPAGDDIAREYGGEAITVSCNSLADFLPSSHTCMAINLFLDSILGQRHSSTTTTTTRHHQTVSTESPYHNPPFTPQASHTLETTAESGSSSFIPTMDFATFTGSAANSISHSYPSSSGVSRSSTPYSLATTPPPPSSSQTSTPSGSSPHHNPARAQYERNRSILQKSGVPIHTSARLTKQQ
ncbi:Rab-like protein 3 [Podila humilis]|nr:Rab-like protein 3 [Podila humilis]